MAKYIMALDAGTTSNRCLLFDKEGNICSVAQKEFPQYFPHPGWVEHDANEIWQSQLSVAREAMQKIGATYQDVAAIGIANQRETTIVWDRKTGQPIGPAIVWQCRRTADYAESLKNCPGMIDCFRRKTGLIIDPYFSGTKIRWILENTPGARERAENGELCFGTVDSWLIHKLTKGKVHVTDYSNASRTMIFNINTLQWDDELCRILDIPMNMLPEVKPSSCVYGESDPEFFGGPIPIAGAAIQWLRDEVKILDDSEESEYFATRVKNTNGCYVVPAFTGLGAPYWDPYARGAILGLTRGVNKFHIVRATLESLAFQTSDVLQVMEQDSGIHMSSLKVDGGASRNNFLMQFQADMIGTPVRRPACVETTAMGASCLAGLAVGFWETPEELVRNQEMDHEFTPSMDIKDREEHLRGWKQAVGAIRGWAQ